MRFSPGEFIAAAKLDALLTTFETATGREVVIYIEACKSGSFVNDLAKIGIHHMVITSTDNKDAYLNSNGSISFTQFFMDALVGGNTFGQSYQKTKLNLARIGPPFNIMTPQLVEGQANTLSPTRLGGNFVIAGLYPEITKTSPDRAVTANTDQSFYAKISTLDGVEAVWAVVLPPDYITPMTSVDFTAPQVAIPIFALTDSGSDNTLRGSYNKFSLNGDYQITFYARNSSGHVAVSPPTIVTVTGGSVPFFPGDVNNDKAVNLADAILAMRIAAGMDVSGQTISRAADVNRDGKIGLPEAIFILQKGAGMR